MAPAAGAILVFSSHQSEFQIVCSAELRVRFNARNLGTTTLLGALIYGDAMRPFLYPTNKGDP